MATEEAAKQAFATIKPAPPGPSPLQSVSGDQLLVLSSLFGKNLEKAMRILEKGGVTRIVAQPSGRVAFQVLAESKGHQQYTCFPEEFCSCPAFHFEVVSRGQHLGCKHQVAARLATSLNILRDLYVSDEQLALILLGM